MCQVHRLTEASAVHDWIEYQQYERDYGEEAEEREHRNAYRLLPHARNQCGAEYGFGKGQAGSQRIVGEVQESQAEELEIFFHYQRCADRVHELEHARHEEHDSYQDGAKSSYGSHILL